MDIEWNLFLSVYFWGLLDFKSLYTQNYLLIADYYSVGL